MYCNLFITMKCNLNCSYCYIDKSPVLQKIDNETYKITVGAIPHPMTEEHYIEYIEVSTNKNERLTFFLNKNEKAEVIFKTSSEILSVFAYCNLHGMWGKKL